MGSLAILATSSLIPPITASASTADDLAAAQARADRAAAAVAQAEVDLAFSTDAVTHAQERVVAAEQAAEEARQQLSALALRQYVRPTDPLPFLRDLSDATQASLALQYSAAAAGQTSDILGQYRAEREDLERELASLSSAQEAEHQTLDELRRQEQSVVAELERLAELDRQRQEREAAEAARRQAEAARRGSPAPAPGPPVAAAATPSAPNGWVCPVAGPNTFTNDYGAPRAGGRSHQGNDLLAPRGTPVVAHVSGVVERNSNNLGGLAYYLHGDDGNNYYGAHLDSYGAHGRVNQGTVIGTVGDSGDARGGPPHLHFEMMVPGRGNVNPYSTLRQAC